jgi:AGZA family xanthine/uracil permease-like MFS transporter
MMKYLEKRFHLSSHKSSIKSEAIGGCTTFMTMAYIIFVQPNVLSAAGMDFGATFTATCIASAIAIVVMGLLANYPIALAPGMGQNFFFSYVVVLAMGVSWQKALGAVFIAGLAFIILSFVGFREKVINAIPDALKHAIAAGIGLMITFIGLEWAGFILDDPSVYVKLTDFSTAASQLALAGLVLTAVLIVWKIPGAMLIGILTTTIIGLISGLIPFTGVFSAPPSLDPTFLKLDITGLLNVDLILVIITFLLLDLFDTIGTLIGVAGEAGLMVDGKLPRAEKALLADAVGTVFGALLGTSTVTSYVESAAGVSGGARTGLANMFTALLFILALFFSPLIAMVGSGIELSNGVVLRPTVAPVLILIGIYMFRNLRHVNWQDFSVSIPVFLTVLTITFSFSPTEGIGFGFISYTLLKLVTGRIREVPLLLRIFAVVFLIKYFV